MRKGVFNKKKKQDSRLTAHALNLASYHSTINAIHKYCKAHANEPNLAAKVLQIIAEDDFFEPNVEVDVEYRVLQRHEIDEMFGPQKIHVKMEVGDGK